MSEKFFQQKVDRRSRKEMIKFLTEHYRYNTMNSWNGSTSYANKVKLWDLNLPSDIKDDAWNFIYADYSDFYGFTIPDLIALFREETGYDVGFNGRSNGYLVMYECERALDEHKSYCPLCGQKNFQEATETNKKCGRCGKESRINYIRPLYRWVIYPGRSIGTDDPEEYEDWTMDQLKREVALVQRFDELCDDIRDAFIEAVRESEIIEEEYTVTQTRTVVV